jgi:hypothetical protein
MPKDFKPEVVLTGGSAGQFVRSLKGPPNSYVRGQADHVFETDAHGKIIRDISPQRVKVRRQHRSPSGLVFEEMEKADHPVGAEEVVILRRMGVLK